MAATDDNAYLSYSPSTVTVLGTSDRSLWRSCLPAGRSVFGSLEMATIAEQYLGYSPRLFVFRLEETTVTYPLLLRTTATLPFTAGRRPDGWDSLSPEYTGPLASQPITARAAEHFRRCLADFCRQERIISEFAHLHPWHWTPELHEPGAVSPNRQIVYVDLNWPEERLQTESFTYACRKNIKRAEAAGVRVWAAESLAEIGQFHRLYTQTMDRNQAQARYYFPLEYFAAIFASMPANARFVLAAYEGQVVAGTLYLHDDTDVYSYLGGADYAFQHLRPTNAVIRATIGWAQQQGKQRLILGGGYQPNDSIFRFKASFSPLSATFQVYRQVHLPHVYAALNQAWSAHYQRPIEPAGYFPAYRWTPV